jgi:hypothetical protein
VICGVERQRHWYAQIAESSSIWQRKTIGDLGETAADMTPCWDNANALPADAPAAGTASLRSTAVKNRRGCD